MKSFSATQWRVVVILALLTALEQLWVLRFIQAIDGCGGIVISRAVVTDYFDKQQTLEVFSLLSMIMGAAPIIVLSGRGKEEKKAVPQFIRIADKGNTPKR